MTGCEGINLAQRPFDMAGIPMNAVALLADGECLVCRVYERRHAVRERVARNLLEYLVAVGAAREREAAPIEWIMLHHLPNLIAEKLGFDIEDVGSGAQPLITCQQRAPLLTREAKQLRAGECLVADHISAHQSEPAREPVEHPIGSELRRLLGDLSGILHYARYSIAKQPPNRLSGHSC